MTTSDKRFFETFQAALSAGHISDAEHALEETAWWAVQALRERDDSSLRSLAAACNVLGQSNRSSGNSWQVWCSGQLQMIATLCRSALALQVPRAVLLAVRERKNFLPILQVIGERDVDASTIASAIGLNLSYALRELAALEELKLVQSEKGSRQRWFRVTPLGYQALAEFGQPSSAARVPVEEESIEEPATERDAGTDLFTSEASQEVMRGSSDQELMDVIQRGDPSAASEIYDRYSVGMYNVAFRYLGDANVARDAVQEVFVMLLEHANEFQADAKLSAWLFLLTTNWCRDYLGRVKSTANATASAADVAAVVLERRIQQTLDPELKEYIDFGVANPNASTAELAAELGISRPEIPRMTGRLAKQFPQWSPSTKAS